jgi:hypothetical protein
MLNLACPSIREVVSPLPARRRMRVLPCIWLIAFFAFPMLCRAQENCLWMNAATAGGILGGAATVSVTHPKTQPAKLQPANVTSGAGPMSANPSGASYGANTVDDADCAFHRQPPTAGALSIRVWTVSEPAKAFAASSARCGAHGAPLKAIGNEAVVCELNKKSKQLSEQVVGRVRDRLFVIDLSVEDPSIAQSELREKARATAEIVSGNLF